MEQTYKINYTFATPQGDVVPDIAYVSGKDAKNAAMRLQNFINQMAYFNYAGRKLTEIQTIIPVEKVLKNVLIQTEKNGRLN